MKQNFKKLAVVLHVLQTTQNWSFHVVVLPRTAKKCTKIYNARAQPLFCSLNLLFSDVPVAAAVLSGYLKRSNTVTKPGGLTLHAYSGVSQNKITSKLPYILHIENVILASVRPEKHSN